MNAPSHPLPTNHLKDRVAALEARHDSDQRDLAVQNAMLTGIERMRDASTREEVLAVLAQTLKVALGTKQVLVLGDTAEAFFAPNELRHEVIYPARYAANHKLSDGLMSWLSSQRDLPDLSGNKGSPNYRELMALLDNRGSLISAPFEREGGQMLAVLCWHPLPGYFTTDHIGLLRRLTQMMGFALRSLRLDDRHEVLASVVENADAPVMVAEPNERGGRIVYVNQAFEKMSGYSWREVKGQKFISEAPAQTAERRALRRAFLLGQPGRFTVHNHKRDGSKFLNEISLSVIRNSDGTVRYILATHADVTERAERQRELQLVEQRLETAIEAVSTPILVLDASGDAVYHNTAMSMFFEKLGFGYLFPTAAGQALLEQCPEVGGAKDIRCEDGSVYLTRSFVSKEGGRVITASDLTEVRKAEQTLKLRALAMDSTTEGIAITDRAAHISYANPAFTRIFNSQDPADIIGQKWFAPFAEANVKHLKTDIRPKLRSDGSARVLMKAPHPDGLQTFEVSITAIDDQMRIIVAVNVTRRIEYEAAKANLQEKMQQFEKNESIGRLAAGVAHDFNNLLAVINGHAALLNEGTPKDKVKLYSDRINEASSRAAKMINRFLDLGMSSDSQSMIDLRNLLSEGQDLLASTVSADTEFSLEMADEEMEMLCSPSDLLRVALNLVQNAQDAMEGRPGKIRQTLTRHLGTDLMDHKLAIGSIDPALTYACYSVSDDGCGIPPEVQCRLFRDHYSSKGERGSGIGLMSIAEIVENHDGAIRLLSSPMKGTTFEIYLPLSAVTLSALDDSEIGNVRLDEHLILLVDDDLQVAESIAAYLERLGAEVAICERPDEALETVREDPGMWSLMLSDYNMPGMNGGQLAKAAREADPKLPVLIITALARKLSDPNLNETTIDGLLAKPVDLNTLAHLIEKHSR